MRHFVALPVAAAAAGTACALFAASSPGFDRYLTGSEADVRTATSAGLLLSGGGGDADEAFRWFLAKAGEGDIVVLRASGSDGYNKYLAGLSPIDSVESFVIKSRHAASDPLVIRKLQRAEGIFLAGGDQWKYVQMWKGTPLGREISRAYARGIPVGGTSAGLAVLGEFSFSAEFDTITSKEALADPFDKRVALESAFLKFQPLQGWITDSHFSGRDRMGRLCVFLARLQAAGRPAVTGIGIDEGTAVLLEGSAKARVIGRGAAWLVRPTADAELRSGLPVRHAEFSACRVPAGSPAFFLNRASCPNKEDEYTLTIRTGVITSSKSRNSLY